MAVLCDVSFLLILGLVGRIVVPFLQNVGTCIILVQLCFIKYCQAVVHLQMGRLLFFGSWALSFLHELDLNWIWGHGW